LAEISFYLTKLGVTTSKLSSSALSWCAGGRFCIYYFWLILTGYSYLTSDSSSSFCKN